jgi:hypothetical protein
VYKRQGLLSADLSPQDEPSLAVCQEWSQFPACAKDIDKNKQEIARINFFILASFCEIKKNQRGFSKPLCELRKKSASKLFLFEQT